MSRQPPSPGSRCRRNYVPLQRFPVPRTAELPVGRCPNPKLSDLFHQTEKEELRCVNSIC